VAISNTQVYHLDVTGHKCPIPVLRLRKMLEIVPVGTYISIKATDPMTQLDIPHFCHEKGCMLEKQWEENGIYHYLVRHDDADEK
tara:strand:- start:21190 stop:21444 length:255 start_codon:yes stop_codon:yes gene_type:complete